MTSHGWMILLLGLFVAGCQRNVFQGHQDKSNRSLEELAHSVLGKEAQIERNATNDFALVFRNYKSRPHDIFPAVDFFVFDLKNDTVVFKKSLPQGKVGWYSRDEVIYQYLSGPAERQQERYIYNVKTRQVRTLHE